MYFIPFSCFTQEYILEGKIIDKNTQEVLSGVNLIFPDLKTGTISEEDGTYKINLPQGAHRLVISYLGYKETVQQITLKKDMVLNFSLEPSLEDLDEIVITKNKGDLDLSKAEMSVNVLKASTIKNVPAVLGESDVIKSLILLPGVTSGGEAAGGFNVRGGGSDQNLVLMDNTMMFNESHLFGFFSVFNPDAVQDLKLYKGGIPAEFGGRASSVLDVAQRTGNIEEFHMNGGIGVVSSRLLAEGPIQKSKSAFVVAGRSSYAHLFLKLADNPNSGYFYDLNTKLNFLLNQNNTLQVSGYFGRDIFNINDSFKNSYGSSFINLHWKHDYSNALSSELSLAYSEYYFGLNLDLIGFNWESGIDNFSLKYSFKHSLSENFQLNYGINSTYYQFNPGHIEPTGEDSGIINKQLSKKYVLENGIYVDVDHQVLNQLAISYGLRLSSFHRLGQEGLNVYENDNPLLYNEELHIYEKAPILYTYEEPRSKSIEDFVNLEPRISISYRLNEESSIKANYHRMNQYIHLLSNSNTPTPLDIWTPSGKYVQPQQADQVSFGYFRKMKNFPFTLETEVFYKNINNSIDYTDGANLIANDAIEQVILNGKSRAYGLELLLKKTSGDFTGWASYTLSKSEQKTPGRTPEETGINNGEWYNNSWDKTHDFSFTGTYKLNKKWKFNTNFVIQTGQPATFPDSKYTYYGISVPNYGKRNAERLPAYHHLDVSATYTPQPKKRKTWQGEWVFSIYNLYNRRNAASINFSENEDSRRNEAVRLSIFGIIPSITYNFKF